MDFQIAIRPLPKPVDAVFSKRYEVRGLAREAARPGSIDSYYGIWRTCGVRTRHESRIARYKYGSRESRLWHEGQACTTLIDVVEVTKEVRKYTGGFRLRCTVHNAINGIKGSPREPPQKAIRNWESCSISFPYQSVVQDVPFVLQFSGPKFVAQYPGRTSHDCQTRWTNPPGRF